VTGELHIKHGRSAFEDSKGRMFSLPAPPKKTPHHQTGAPLRPQEDGAARRADGEVAAALPRRLMEVTSRRDLPITHTRRGPAVCVCV